MKCTHVPEIETLFLEREERQNHSSVFDFTTMSEEGSGKYNKNLLFLWKYQLSQNTAF